MSLEGFEDAAKNDIESLKGEPNGIELLRHIGYVYYQEAKQHLGGVFGLAEELFEKAHVLKETVETAKAANLLSQAQKNLNKADDTERAGLEAKYMEEGTNSFWDIVDRLKGTLLQ